MLHIASSLTFKHMAVTVKVCRAPLQPACLEQPMATTHTYRDLGTDSSPNMDSSPPLFGVLLPITSRGTSNEVLRANLARLGASLRSTVESPADSLRVYVGIDQNDPSLGDGALSPVRNTPDHLQVHSARQTCAFLEPVW